MVLNKRFMLPPSKDLKRVLVVRNDGLGDFILTLPLIDALAHSGIEVWTLASRMVADLAECLPCIAGVVCDAGVLLKRDRNLFTEQERLQQQQQLLAEVRALKADAVFLPYAEETVARLMHQARIPLRVGPLRRWFSWRFNRFERGGRQKAGLAEYWLNLQMLKAVGLPVCYQGLPAIKLPPFSHLPILQQKPLVVMHALKSAGTALSWPLSNFVILSQLLAQAGWQPLVVGSLQEHSRLSLAFKDSSALLLTSLSLPQLAALLRQAKLFIGNSSGPLHLAALVGVQHIGFYPQNMASSPVRWRTLPNKSHQTPLSAIPPYLLHSHFPKNCVLCEKERCNYFNCVASIEPQQVMLIIESMGLALSSKNV